MKNFWTLLSYVALAAALTACKSGTTAPDEGENTEATEAAADEKPAAESEAVAQKIVAEGAAPEGIPAPPDVAAPPETAERSASGLAWTVLQAGTGDQHPSAHDIVTVNYTGWTTDGRMFDSSTKRGKPAEFPLKHSFHMSENMLMNIIP